MAAEIICDGCGEPAPAAGCGCDCDDLPMLVESEEDPERFDFFMS